MLLYSLVIMIWLNDLEVVFFFWVHQFSNYKRYQAKKSIRLCGSQPFTIIVIKKTYHMSFWRLKYWKLLCLVIVGKGWNTDIKNLEKILFYLIFILIRIINLLYYIILKLESSLWVRCFLNSHSFAFNEPITSCVAVIILTLINDYDNNNWIIIQIKNNT